MVTTITYICMYARHLKFFVVIVLFFSLYFLLENIYELRMQIALATTANMCIMYKFMCVCVLVSV